MSKLQNAPARGAPVDPHERCRARARRRLRGARARGDRAIVRADRVEVRRGAARVHAVGARGGRLRRRDDRARAPRHRVVPRGVGDDRVRVHRRDRHRHAQHRDARTVPARHGVVGVRPRLPVHPARAAGARHVVARPAPTRAVQLPPRRMPREDVQGTRRGARGLRPVGGDDRQVRRRAPGPSRGDRPAAQHRRGRGAAIDRRHVRPQPARAARTREVPRLARERSAEARAARHDGHRRDAPAAVRPGAGVGAGDRVRRARARRHPRRQGRARRPRLPLRRPRRRRRRPAHRSRRHVRVHGRGHRRRDPAGRASRVVDLGARAPRRGRRASRDRTARPHPDGVGHRRARRRARARTRLPDREPDARVRGAHPRRRRLRRLAHRRRHAVSRRDLGRRQSHVRGRREEAGRGVRARPRARPLRPRRRRRVRRAHPRHGGVHEHPRPDRHDPRRRRALARASSPTDLGADAPGGSAVAARGRRLESLDSRR